MDHLNSEKSFSATFLTADFFIRNWETSKHINDNFKVYSRLQISVVQISVAYFFESYKYKNQAQMNTTYIFAVV